MSRYAASTSNFANKAPKPVGNHMNDLIDRDVLHVKLVWLTLRPLGDDRSTMSLHLPG